MRGIDVGAKAEIERLIVALADTGLGVLVTSSELEEVLGLGDRIVIVRDGRTTGEIGRQGQLRVRRCGDRRGPATTAGEAA